VPQALPPVVLFPPARPERLRRREAHRQKTLAQRKQALPPTPAQERYTHSEYCWIGGFRSWTAATVPIAVVCLRDHYADGQHQDWALMSIYPGQAPLRLLGYYRRRPAIVNLHPAPMAALDVSGGGFGPLDAGGLGSATAPDFLPISKRMEPPAQGWKLVRARGEVGVRIAWDPRVYPDCSCILPVFVL
jgi:hypothetical protein